MSTARLLRRHLAELVVVFVGVALAFAVDNLRESISERAIEAQYLSGFRRDLMADSAMLREQQEARRAQVDNALVVLEFYDGRSVDPKPFFSAYFSALFALRTAPNGNTMDEVLKQARRIVSRSRSPRTKPCDLQLANYSIQFTWTFRRGKRVRPGPLPLRGRRPPP